MKRTIIFDSVGYDPDRVKSFKSEKEFIDEMLLPERDHIYHRLKKADRIKKFKLIYNLCKNAKDTSLD